MKKEAWSDTSNTGNSITKKDKFLLSIGIFILTFIFSISMASASFTLGTPNYSIEKIYGPSQEISGWINISFNSESLDSNFTSTIGSVTNTINLSNILKINARYNYSCSPKDCKNDYSAGNGQDTKTITLSDGESKVYGLKLTGAISSINSIDFNLQSDAPASCVNQIKVDIFDDGIIDFVNNKSTNSPSCSSNSGCYSGGNDSEYDLDIQYCQKINLSEAPGFILGAWIKKSGTRNITIGLFDDGLTKLADCQLPDAPLSGDYVSCGVNYTVDKPKEYFVCVYPQGGEGIYKIKGHLLQNGCGFSGINKPSKLPAAYDFFARGKQFDSPGTLRIYNSIAGGNTLANLASDYLAQRYGSMDCTSGCVIPIRLISKADQNITLNNLSLRYTQQNAGQLTENRFYDVETTPAKITSGFKTFYMTGAGFKVPSNLGNYTFSLILNDQTVISEKIQVKDIPIINSVSPIKTASAFPTEFVVDVKSKYNITDFSWDFGDGTTKVTTQKNKTTHTYNQKGEYTLTINVTDSRGFSSSRTFLINVTSPSELIEINLAQLKTAINDIRSDISSFDPFSKSAINFSLGLDSLETSVNKLQTRYSTATTDAELNAIVTDILKLGTLPESLLKTKGVAGLTFIAGAEKVNLDFLKSISGESLKGNKEDYKNAAAFWAIDKIATSVDFNEYSGVYKENKILPVVKTFKITVREKKEIDYDYFLIMPKLNGFYSDSEFRSENGYIYINLKKQKTVSFSTTEDIDVVDLPAFISPPISKLSVGDTTLPPEKNKPDKWLILGLVMFALLVVAVIVYIILREWYKKKYESHLFPNRNDLYNLANYIHNAKRKGMSNKDIEENLKKAGWSGEKIRYAMRKYAGKRTGMP